jgi:hypothetical protein
MWQWYIHRPGLSKATANRTVDFCGHVDRVLPAEVRLIEHLEEGAVQVERVIHLHASFVTSQTSSASAR